MTTVIHREPAKSFLPLLDTLRNYRRRWVRNDVAAGFSACIVMIPAVITYAALSVQRVRGAAME